MRGWTLLGRPQLPAGMDRSGPACTQMSSAAGKEGEEGGRGLGMGSAGLGKPAQHARIACTTIYNDMKELAPLFVMAYDLQMEEA